MKTIKRYIKLYCTLAKGYLQGKLIYRGDAIIGIFSFLLSNVASLFTLGVVITSITSLNGLGMYELGFLYGVVMIVKCLDHMFADALWNIGYWYIPSGNLDKHLVRPVHPLFQIIAGTVQVESLGEAILGVTLLVICGCNLTIVWTFEKLFLLIVCFIFGALVITGLKLITSSIALWTKRSGIIMQTVYNMSDYAKYPLSIYNIAGVIKYLLLFIVPFGLIMTVPTEFILKGSCEFFGSLAGVGYVISLVIIAFAALFNFIGFRLFDLGLRCYESAGN